MSINARLAEERERLGLSQERLGAVAGVSRNSQANYEKGKRMPDAAYLEALAGAGADVQYVITGQRAITADQLANDLKRLSDAWETLELALEATGRTLTPAKKRKAADALYAASKTQLTVDKEKLTELILQLAA